MNFGKVSCPFCFSSFTAERVRFRCIQPPNRCQGWENDGPYAKYRQIPVSRMGHVTELKESDREKRNFSMKPPRSYPCNICDAECYNQLCPECHFLLPHDIWDVKQKIIVVIGSRSTGKSHYISSLVKTMRTNSQNDLLVSLFSDSTQERYIEDYHQQVFDKNSVLPATSPASVDARVKIPLILRLKSKENEWKRRAAGLWDREINTCLFDTAGEDMVRADTLSMEGRAILHADGLIFMLDPLQIASVQQQLPGTLHLRPDPLAHPDHLLDRIIALFESHGKVKAKSKIAVPTAFVVSKVDALGSIVDKSATFLQPSGHGKELNRSELDSIHSDISSYLKNWLTLSFCDKISDRFTTHRYFGVSALGRQTNIQTRLETVEPWRVEEPFLWLLAANGFVKVH